MLIQKALVLEEFGKAPIYKDWPVSEPKQGQMLVKMEGSTINFCDRCQIAGSYEVVPLPNAVGFEGTGRVVKINGVEEQWLNKRVSFFCDEKGSWGEYALTSPKNAFVIDQDVPLSSAASGLVNPLSVIGLIHVYQSYAHRVGMINTAASSALGRMINRVCIKLNIPLLNVVRKQQHVELLKSQGAKHIIVTQGDWQQQYKNLIENHGFNILLDALGGGPVLESLIAGLKPNSTVVVYSDFESTKLTVSWEAIMNGITITGFNVFNWHSTISQAEKQEIRSQYSERLKTDLFTNTYRVLKYEEIELALELSISHAVHGKITLVPK